MSSYMTQYYVHVYTCPCTGAVNHCKQIWLISLKDVELLSVVGKHYQSTVYYRSIENLPGNDNAPLQSFLFIKLSLREKHIDGRKWQMAKKPLF